MLDELYEGLKNMETPVEKIFGMLWEISKRPFLENVKFGLVAVDVMGAARHFCGYENEPTQEDFENLLRELRTDESFGLVDEHFIIEDAPQEVVDSYIRELGDEI